MPGFINPLWLIALGLIPLIRWLHRWQSPLSSWPVSALFLWRNSTADQQAGKEKRPPEPAWRRRALAAAFMITALSGPYLQSESRSLTVWIDDSLSLGTVENGSTRLETLFARLASALEDHDPAWEEVTLRSLTNPGRAQHYSAGDFGAIDPDALFDPFEMWRSEEAGPVRRGSENRSEQGGSGALAIGSRHQNRRRLLLWIAELRQ